ncbi:MmgE/PrpD family protein [Haladaptatus sp. AB643]|uniref:MmgE/PrpD family protein n=1 Tax=Haladaptatus sp. AB643 TaxID=2934174 RepID=UPI00209C1788|nr:MmgE/PrpD family protein [Haladaptatus sp. AB643]MCO8245395.1 MmgE/PrpD family protein [Haladaptatus sp. AB643]
MAQNSTHGQEESPVDVLADFISECTYDDVPDAAHETVVRAITDTVGVTLAGTRAGSSEIVTEFTTGHSSGDGFPDPSAAETDADIAELALAYGTASHALDYDDLSWAMDGHPSVVLLPPILALADRVDPTGEEVVTAYAAGFETACYVAAPISPSHYEAGWHATSTFGAFGATAVAASLLDLDMETTACALHVAASTPAGTKENFGSMTKPIHAGLAARSGVTAALLAADGFTAGDGTLNGSRGFWRLYGPETEDDVEVPTAPTSDGWLLERRGIHIKRYPACYFTHSSIAATRSLADEHGIVPTDVERVVVEAAGGAGDALTYERPTDALQSKFSMQHAVAVAIASDRVSLGEFTDEAATDDRFTQLYPRIDFAVDESMSYDSHAARVTIETADGSHQTVREHPPWTHEHPPTTDELEAKFVETATRAITESDAHRAFEALQSLPSRRLSDVLAPLVGSDR